MKDVRVLLIDASARCCQEPNCPGVHRLLRESKLTQISGNSSVPCAGPQPDCIVVCGCGRQLVESLRSVWAQVPLLGVFCPPRPAAEMSELLRCGISDFVCCPFSESEFAVRLKGLLPGRAQVRLLSAGQRVRKDHHLSMLVGESEALMQSVAKLPRIAASDANCLLSGESGTGKELFARAIHYMSPRREKPFVPVNCGALPDSLLENELFGHSKGAYTDASSISQGLIASADCGTLFLDEIDTLSVVAQAKVLRFLQEHEYRPLGSNRTITANVRVLAASNVDLRRLLEERLFREDLFYRLNVLHVQIPPLRDRVEDIPLLADHFLQSHKPKNVRGVIGLSPGAIRRLMGYRWPGNIRELEGVIHRAAILSPSLFIQAEEVEIPVPCEQVVNETNLREAKEIAVRNFERAYLTKLLTEYQGNVSRAAKAAGKERRAFQRLLKKYSVDRKYFTARGHPKNGAPEIKP